MLRVGIHGKEFIDSIKPFIEQFMEDLNESTQITVSEKFHHILKNGGIDSYKDVPSFSINDNLDFDLFISLGGDGTLLESVTYVKRAMIPILGVNTGRLGFLATVSRADFNRVFEKIKNGDYTIDERTLLRLETEEKLFNGCNFALNDFTILKQDTSSMIVVHAFVNGEFLNSYWADGVIICTPTGSTGYSISCGGPLVMPHSDNFIITPVSPHNLTVRPIVVPDNAELSFTVEGRNNNFLISLDSRFETIDSSVELKVRKEDFKVRLVKIDETSYFSTLRQKLNWGYDIRN